jgi:hypothetical protein
MRRSALIWALAAVLVGLAAGLTLRAVSPPGPPELEEVPAPAILWPPPPDAIGARWRGDRGGGRPLSPSRGRG